ncbi:MAG: hypothetical protein J7J65_07690 [Candidatus Korarchaeota archaeon]|nr:hypothetical protein [Candidatus Korarchaeota archaeon]
MQSFTLAPNDFRYAKPSTKYPFYFLTRRWAGHKHSGPVTSDNPYSLDAFPSPFCWINEETANKLGIGDGDWVYVKSPYGKTKLKAKPTKILRPDCVIVEHAFGHTFSMLRYGGKWPSDAYLLGQQAIKPKITEVRKASYTSTH